MACRASLGHALLLNGDETPCERDAETRLQNGSSPSILGEPPSLDVHAVHRATRDGLDIPVRVGRPLEVMELAALTPPLPRARFPVPRLVVRGPEEEGGHGVIFHARSGIPYERVSRIPRRTPLATTPLLGSLRLPPEARDGVAPDDGRAPPVGREEPVQLLLIFILRAPAAPDTGSPAIEDRRVLRPRREGLDVRPVRLPVTLGETGVIASVGAVLAVDGIHRAAPPRLGVPDIPPVAHGVLRASLEGVAVVIAAPLHRRSRQLDIRRVLEGREC